MSYSLNEYESLALKAARGAGLPWGLAEDAGKAVRILSSFGFESGSLLLEMLEHQQNTSALLIGAHFCDSLDHFSGLEFLEPVQSPGLLIAFIALSVSGTDKCAYCKWSNCEIYVTSQDLFIVSATGFNVTTASPIWIGLAEAPQGKKREKSNRAMLPKDTYNKLTALASKTYAPATEESRIAGAGAGLNDND